MTERAEEREEKERKMTTTTRLRRSKSSVIIVPKRIDNQTELYPPLDYSFHDIEKFQNFFSLWPRRALSGPEIIRENGRYHSYGINLNHNRLNGPLETLPKFIQTILVNPNTLSMLDLSFNKFTEIPSALTHLSSLKYFYFHKNHLQTLTDLPKLCSLNKLKYLTLHGNPIEITVPYLRWYVLSLLPHLRSLNFSPVSQGDLKTSDGWKQSHNNLFPTSSKK